MGLGWYSRVDVVTTLKTFRRDQVRYGNDGDSDIFDEESPRRIVWKRAYWHKSNKTVR